MHPKGYVPGDVELERQRKEKRKKKREFRERQEFRERKKE